MNSKDPKQKKSVEENGATKREAVESSEPKKIADSSDSKEMNSDANDKNAANAKEKAENNTPVSDKPLPKNKNASSTDSKPSVAHNKTAANTSKSSGTLKFLVGIGLLIALGSSVMSGWLYLEQQRLLENTEQVTSEALNNTQKAVARSDQTSKLVEELSTKLNEQDSRIELLSQTNQSLRQQLVNTQDDLRRVMSKGRQEWQLDQAQQYLELAQAKIIIEKDKAVAVALLNEAAKVLRDISDLQLNGIEQSIQEDIDYLLSLPKSEDTQVLIALASLDKLIGELLPIAPQLKSIDELPKVENKAWFDRLLNTVNNVMSEAVTFRTHKETVKPLLTDAELVTVKTSMRLALQQAQTAFAKGQKGYYVDRLNMAQGILSEYFQLNEQATYLNEQLALLGKKEPYLLPDYELSSLVDISALQESRRLQWLSNPSGDSE